MTEIGQSKMRKSCRRNVHAGLGGIRNLILNSKKLTLDRPLLETTLTHSGRVSK